MKYVYKDLGMRSEGEVIRFKLAGKAANVRIMTELNFTNYQYGKEHEFIGGYVTETPVEIIIPKDGHWFATVDNGGFRGKIGADIEVVQDPPVRIYHNKR